MSLADLLPSIRDLSRTEKLRLIQVLADDLAEAEEFAPLAPGLTYPIWSPQGAQEAAVVLLDVLVADRMKP